MARIEFRGKIGDDWRTSEPWWPPVPTPPDGAPNVVLIVLDDVGFAQLGCYGSDMDTPWIDGLAADGVRLDQFPHHRPVLPHPCVPAHGPEPSPQRHGPRRRPGLGLPGYWGRPPRENGYLSEILRANGYATYAVGKWHLSPEDETNMAASRSTWPLGRGFDRWYGFHGGETHQFVPALYHDNHTVRPPRSVEDGYHLSADLADRAIEYLGDLRAVDVDQPFFLYFCTGACHSPHHAPAEWIEHYRGRFAQGWDRWRDETFDRQLRARRRARGHDAVAAPGLGPGLGTPRRPTEGAGRAVHGVLCRVPLLHRRADRSRCSTSSTTWGTPTTPSSIVVSDNGASSEGGREGTINEGRLSNFDAAGIDEMFRRIDEIGGPLSHNNYPWGWTMAGNTPFKRWKREVHEGGVADPCIVRLPASRRRSAAVGVRRQYAHAVDIAPYGARTGRRRARPARSTGSPSRISTARASPICSAPGAKTSAAAIVTQHFEMLGSRAIYHDGWKAVAFHPVGPLYDDGLSSNAPFDDDVWELYHVAEDVSEVHDLAAEYPEKVVSSVGCGGRRHVATTCSHSTTGCSRRSPIRSPTAGATGHVPVLPGWCTGARAGGRRMCATDRTP